MAGYAAINPTGAGLTWAVMLSVAKASSRTSTKN